jgi:hypothetical protein
MGTESESYLIVSASQGFENRNMTRTYSIIRTIILRELSL